MWEERCDVRLAILGLVLVAIAACGDSGLSIDQLEEEFAPIVEAHDTVRDFQFRVEGGMTYGEIMETWPSVSATVRRAIEDFDPDVAAATPEQRSRIEAYLRAVARAHDEWIRFHLSVGSYIRDEKPESEVREAYVRAISEMRIAAQERSWLFEPED